MIPTRRLTVSRLRTFRTGGPSRRRMSTLPAQWSRTGSIYPRCTKKIASTFRREAPPNDRLSVPLKREPGFPFRTTQPRPEPLATDAAVHDDEQCSISGSESLIDVLGEDDIDVGGDDGGGVQGLVAEDTGVESTGVSLSANSCPTGAGGGSAGSNSARENNGVSGKGDGAFVVPATACSALHGVAPTFGTGIGLAAAGQVWHRLPPPQGATTLAAPSVPRRVMWCRDCGHNPCADHWRQFHHGGGRHVKRVCLVHDNLRRTPDRPTRKTRFDPCKCLRCNP